MHYYPWLIKDIAIQKTESGVVIATSQNYVKVENLGKGCALAASNLVLSLIFLVLINTS